METSLFLKSIVLVAVATFLLTTSACQQKTSDLDMEDVPISLQASDSLIGAWSGQSVRGGASTVVVVIFTPAYQVAVWYDPQTGAVVHTNGGTWSREGAHVTETVEFDSDRPERAGSSVSFDINLAADELSVVGSETVLTRIDQRRGTHLEAAWEMYESSGIGSSTPPDSLIKVVRMMSASRFQEVTYELGTGKLIATSGGTYLSSPQEYTETITFSTVEDTLRGQPITYKNVQENAVWKQMGYNQRERLWRKR